MHPRALVMALCVSVLAAAPARGQVINACAKPNGNLRVVDDLTACGRNETPLSWSVQGPKGDKGDPGTPGMDGKPGSHDGARVFDREGRVIGVPIASGLDVQLPGRFDEILLNSGVVVRLVERFRGSVPGFELARERIVYTERNCQGTGYFEGSGGALGNRVILNVREASGLSITSKTAPNVAIFRLSGRWSNELECTDPEQEFVGDVWATPILPFDGDLGLSLPMSGPLYIGLRPQ